MATPNERERRDLLRDIEATQQRIAEQNKAAATASGQELRDLEARAEQQKIILGLLEDQLDELNSLKNVVSKNLRNFDDIDETEIEDMDRLHPVAYSWNSDNENKKHYGFIAQDVEKIYPNLTDGRIMGEYLTIKYNELIPIMVKQIQNLKKEVNTLKQVLSNGK